MRKVVAIGGEPGAGKTALVKRLIDHYGYESFRQFTYGLLRGYTRDNLIILGVYPVTPGTREDKPTPHGTDFLSAYVLEDARQFVESLKNIRKEKYADTVILFEGDRLFTKQFLKPCLDNSKDLIVLILTASKEIRSERGGSHAPRYKNNTEWIKSKAAKVWGAASIFGARKLQNDTWSDQDDNFQRLLKYIS